MKNVTQNFINDIKTYGRQFDFNVTINNESISNDNINYIKPAFYTSNENNKTALFTTIMQQLKIDTKNELAINSKIEIEAGIKVNESNYQYISYNPCTVSSCEKQEDTNSYVSLAYDKMIESMIDYDLELSEKITVRNYLILICNRLGWSTEHIPSTFINHNKLVDPALHQGINYTFRMALDEIATITCSFLLFKGEDFYLIYPTETNQIIDSSFLDEDNVNIGERYFINSLVFSRAEGSDNIYRKDNESIENNGLHEFKISNNQLLSTNDRDIYIDQMFNYLKTFEFYTFDVQSKGILFLEACDRFTFNLSGNIYSTILLNNEQEFEDGLIEKLYVDRPEETETEYKYADETDKRINQTYLLVDKQNQKIESLVQETVETKLNNMQIGGTNLLRGTNTVTALTSPGTWARGTWRQAGTGTGTRTSINVSDSPNANIKVGWSTASTSGQVLICQDNVPTTAGEIYTISCYAKGTGKITLQYGNETLNYITSMQTITDENNWKKYSYTFTSRGTANAYFGSGNANNNVSFCGMKLEKGNVTTDWSPAPEDIESNLSTNYYTKTETNSQITQKASEIVSTVNKTISNIQTGTENLLLNTAIKENTNNWTLASGITRTTSKTTPNGNYCFYYNISGLTSNSWRCANPADVSVQPGEILTADVNVFIPSSNDIDGEVALEIQYFNSSRTRIGYLKKLIDTTIVDKWQKATVTLEAPTNTAYANARVWVLKNGKFYVGDLMLSRGNTSTSWTPSSKDYSTTTEMNSAITQKANEISSVVSQRISAVQIGGTNLIKNSAPYNLNNWIDFDSTLSLANESSAPFSKAIKVHFADTSGTGAFNSIEKRLEVGKEYSWSVYIKASKSTELTVGQEQGGTKVVNLTTSWQKFTHTFTATNEQYNSFVFYCYSNARQNGLDIYIHSLKLEEGNKITSWSVNPNDEVTEYNVISKINQTAEAVQIDANKISLVGKQINLTGDNTTITSNNFSVDASGNMSCSNANITGGKVNVSGNGSATDLIRVSNSNGSSEFSYIQPVGAGFVGSSGRIDIMSKGSTSDLSFVSVLVDGRGTEITNNGITTPTVTQTSLERDKKNFEKLVNGLEILKKIDIYKYNLKNEREGTKKHIGFVIGESFKYAHEITAENKDGEEIGVDTYSMVSVLWRAVQEQQEIIEDLKSRIEKLEKKVNK